MKKSILALVCAAVLALSACAPLALAAGPVQYPVSVEEYTAGESGEPRIKKVYQLSLSDDPASIPTDDFERDGVVFRLLDMTVKNEIGVDKKDYSEQIQKDSTTGDMAAVLKQLDAQKEVRTEDGYSGTLLLDHNSVSVKAKGYIGRRVHPYSKQSRTANG